MRLQIAVFCALAALMPAAGATFTGVITDSMCDNANHKDMNMGPDPKCVTECIKSMGGKYVLFDGKTAYTLSDQKTPEKFAAKKVKVTGTLDAKTKTIHVERIEAAQ